MKIRIVAAILMLMAITGCEALGIPPSSRSLESPFHMPTEIDPPARSNWNYGPAYEEVEEDVVTVIFEQSATLRYAEDGVSITASSERLAAQVNYILAKYKFVGIGSSKYTDSSNRVVIEYRFKFSSGSDIPAIVTMFRAIPEVEKAYLPPRLSGDM